MGRAAERLPPAVERSRTDLAAPFRDPGTVGTVGGIEIAVRQIPAISLVQ